jgi:NADPH:quinone reductase
LKAKEQQAMATMKAIRIEEYGGPEVLQYVDVEKPEADAGKVLIKVHAAGINYAETMQRQNKYLTPTKLPSVLGSEAAGVVEEVGAGVTNLKVGDRVLTLGEGAYAQYVVAPARGVFPLPANVSFEQAVTIPVQGLTAYEILKFSGQLKPGESVLVHAAAGGVGVYAVQLAKLLGAGMVIATASTAEKLELAKSLGADQVINYAENKDWHTQVRELTGGKGADVILEMVGGEVFNQNLKCLATFGRMVVFGAASNEIPTLNPMQLMYRNHSVVGYWLVNTLKNPQLFVAHMSELLGWIATGKVKLHVEHTFPLSQTAKAHEAIESRQTTGKVVLLPHAE